MTIVGQSAFTSGVFEVPAENSLYELTLSQFTFPSSAPNWKRSTQVVTTWSFRSHLELDVFSRVGGPSACSRASPLRP